jgi:predicted RNA-binding protein YlqC (UPF0109 family)
MKELIKYIAQALVDNPDQVRVEEVEGNQTSVLELKVAKEDLGKVIGKQGRAARAMRNHLECGVRKAKVKETVFRNYRIASWRQMIFSHGKVVGVHGTAGNLKLYSYAESTAVFKPGIVAAGTAGSQERKRHIRSGGQAPRTDRFVVFKGNRKSYSGGNVDRQ